MKKNLFVLLSVTVLIFLYAAAISSLEPHVLWESLDKQGSQYEACHEQ